MTAYTKYYYKITAFDSLDLSYDNYGIESPYTAAVNATPNNKTFVAKVGNNNNIGSEISPKLTITNAISNSTTGDTIIINKGTYNETIDYLGKSLLITSNNLLIFL